jgi:hypothetical protein
VKSIRERLRAGESPERLRRAATAYAADLDAGPKKKEPRWRQSANTFYGDESRAKYKDYRDRPVQTTVTPEERPDLMPAAERLSEAYRTRVGSSHSAAKSGPLILGLLASGEGEERLMGAIRRYARRCEKLPTDARMGAPAFFGGRWLEHAPPVRVPVPPYEPRSSLTEAELASRTHLATKSRKVIEYYDERVFGCSRLSTKPSLLVARILLDGEPPVELLAACDGYADAVRKDLLEDRDKLQANQFFAGEWQVHRATPPPHDPFGRAKELAKELAKTEEEMERDDQAAGERIRQYREQKANGRVISPPS